MRPGMTAPRVSIRLALAAPWIALAALIALAAAPLVPPPARGGQGPEDFPALRAFEHIDRIAQEPRPIGTLGNERARDDIVEQLLLLGLEAELQTTRVRD